MTDNSSVDFKLILFQLWLKDFIKIPILRLRSALVKTCNFPHVIFHTESQLKVMLDKSVNKDLAEEMQFLDKCSLLNFDLLDFPLLVSIIQIPHMIFEVWSQFCINFAT